MIHYELEDNPDFTVVLPVFNGQNFIASCLDSMVKQEFGNFELIIVDDGSTDKTKEVIDKFSFDRRIRYFKKDNGGTGSALNLGHSQARGRYITWVSHDNIYLPHFLSTFYSGFQEIEQQKIPVEYLYADFIYIDSMGRKIGEVIHKEPQPKKDLCNGYDLGIAFAYTKNLYEKTGPYTHNICEDFEWATRAACHTNFALIKSVLAAFRVHGSQITGSRKEQEEAAALECKKQAARFINEGRYE